MRYQRILVLLGLASLVWISLLLIRPRSIENLAPQSPESSTPHKTDEPSRPVNPPIPESSPAPLNGDPHPVAQLLSKARKSWDNVRSRQSKTLEDAVKEYQRRYRIPPPPNFDVWFSFAKERGVELIDEYDNIYQSLLPFWSLPPKVIRGRAKEALGFSNALIAVMIRDGNVSLVAGEGESQEWKRNALSGMLQSFVEFLPDMDLPFNTHDEPRVVIPGDDLQRLVSNALDAVFPRIVANTSVKSTWTKPDDLNKGDRVDEVKTSRFNMFAHQPTWSTSRSSCPAVSPARDLSENAADKVNRFLTGELGLVHNVTAFSDICLSPSLRYTFGLFDRPNAMNVVRDLFPIFSESKVSSFQDILYPSPWYWAGRVTYKPKEDRPWTQKKDQVYWRGSTTGGFSRAGGWRRQHRQLFVKKTNAVDDVKVLENVEGKWKAKTAKQSEFKGLFDVKFSHVGQCDPEDCDAQTRFFNIVEPATQETAWQYKYLADIDGNAYSGRFYSLLRSNSLVFKLAIFREWHSEWLKPWVHYIPWSLTGDERTETVRYIATEKEGQQYGAKMAQESTEWANKALKNEALEAWFFRLLLEYGRIVDDNREHLGFSLKTQGA